MGLAVVCMTPWALARTSEAASAVSPASVHCGRDKTFSVLTLKYLNLPKGEGLLNIIDVPFSGANEKYYVS